MKIFRVGIGGPNIEPPSVKSWIRPRGDLDTVHVPDIHYLQIIRRILISDKKKKTCENKTVQNFYSTSLLNSSYATSEV